MISAEMISVGLATKPDDKCGLTPLERGWSSPLNR